MARFKTIDRDLQMATAGIAPGAIAQELARFAQDALLDAITSGEGSPVYDTYVNGRHNVSETLVEPPGPILYVFSWWEPIIKFALEELNKRSPVLTGRYQASHEVMLGSQFIRPDTQIGADEEVTIVNTQPYSRKIEVGFMKMSMPDAVYQDVRKKVQSQFGAAVQVRFQMIYIPNGYILKGRFRRGYKDKARTKLQKDTQAGARMSYPALILRMR